MTADSRAVQFDGPPRASKSTPFTLRICVVRFTSEPVMHNVDIQHDDGPCLRIEAVATPKHLEPQVLLLDPRATEGPPIRLRLAHEFSAACLRSVSRQPRPQVLESLPEIYCEAGFGQLPHSLHHHLSHHRRLRHKQS